MLINIAQPLIGEDELRNVRQVLESGQLAAGALVRQLEREFAGMVGVKHAVATSSGTTALQTAVRAVGLARGDMVITTPFSFVASTNALLDVGAVPFYVDVDPQTYNLAPEAVEQALRRFPGVRAILAVHLYGLPFDSRLIAISQQWGVTLIEDAAQAHGAAIGECPVGSLGEIAAFSFYPTKNMTTAEGGMVTTNDPHLAKRARLIANQGQQARYEYACLGFNYRMTELQAAIGLPQLQQLLPRNRRRAEIAAFYLQHLPRELCLPFTPSGHLHVYHQFTLRSKHRSRLMTALAREGIATAIHYPRLISQELYLQAYPHLSEPCPQAEQIVQQVFSIPVHPGLSDAQASTVVAVLNREWELIKRGN